MAVLGPTRLFDFGKNSHLNCFLRNKYKKNPTYTPLLRPTRLSISEKNLPPTRWAPRLLRNPEYFFLILN